MKTYATFLTMMMILLYSITGTSGGELSGGGIHSASLTEHASDSESEKQDKARKLFKQMTTEQALASNRFYKKYPWLYYPEANQKSLMHDDCFTQGYLFGGAYRKCIDFNEEVNECLETEIAPLLMPEEDAPRVVTGIFYRKITGGTAEQTSSEYRVGSREVEIPQCK